MDPVSVFRALHDTNCIKFGQYDLKSGLVAPYYINLRRLPLYPKLMEAVVSQVVEKFLTPRALATIMSQLRAEQSHTTTASCVSSSSSASYSDELERAKLAASSAESCQAAKEGRKASFSAAQAESDTDSHLEDDLIETCSSEESCEEETHGHSHRHAARPKAYLADFKPIISGVPYGAVPLAATIAYKAQLPYLLERKESKSYGDQQPLIHEFDGSNSAEATSSSSRTSAADKGSSKSVILIEDVICSGESTLEAVQSLEKLGLRVEFVICIVDRNENGVNLLLEQRGIRVFSLYNMVAILRVLEATDRITPELFVSTRQWITSHQFKSIGVSPATTTTLTSATTSKCIVQQTSDVGTNPVAAAIEVVSN